MPTVKPTDSSHSDSSTAKHTPGPWKAIKGIEYFKVVTAGCSMVADCGSVSAPTYRDEFEANARLIAAAPLQHDLFKVIREGGYEPLVIWAKQYHCEFPPTIKALNEAISFAMDWAISKAEGQ